ncbi:hypothetical protein SAMN02745857_03085 [Andreprevotia lacus DSM 23236]|jgi:hypothetical protein|uniref:Uncharacterized protein n=1 Tax=Andreprevotia lacus DSM 23236 TaxID=1121001 RepID=A0A1W1XW20_9NEIS|nr:hypothetical protein [Andreprevotia lacus]SMC28052.1 hypothetical protein SAMN02745857_03085 [Andreprevotia lacus DSM 23236]
MKKYIATAGLLASLLAGPALAAATTGWYWNPSEGGTGFMFETQGSSGFAGFFLYDDSGKPVWYVASGTIATNGSISTFQGTLQQFRNGQPANSTTYRTPTASTVGNVRIDFGSGNNATVYLPARTMQATRYDFNGISVGANASQPEVGWYWNPQEGGRGYAIEVQNGKVFLAMFHYASDGSPTWNIVQGGLSTGAMRANFETYYNGQTLSSSYKAPTQVIDGTQFDIDFSDPCVGSVHLSNMPTTQIQRFSFGGLAAGQECRARANGVSAKIPGTYRGNYSGQDYGTFLVQVDAYGRVSGNVYSGKYGGSYAAYGQISPSGQLSVTAATGIAGSANFSGSINTSTSCSTYGSWVFYGTTAGGTFNGTKDGGC